MSGGRRVVTFLALTVLAVFLSINKVQAQYGQYGAPSPSKSVLIDKLVNKPGTGEFVDNLSASDPRFAPHQDVFFKLIVKNTSDIELQDVEVKEFVPDFLEPLEHPGTFDSSSRTITFNAGDFGVDEEKVYVLKMRVLTQDKLPSDRGIMCLLNRAEAKAEGVFDEDVSQFCIEKQVLGVSEVPAAGPGAGLALLALNGLAFVTGFKLRKKI